MDVIEIKKFIKLLTLILIILTAISNSIYARIPLSDSSENKVLVSCKYFTKNGVEEVKKSLKNSEIDHLFKILDTLNIEKLINELEQNKMLPKNYNAKETLNLINRKNETNFLEKLDINFSDINNNLNYYYNYFCFVKGNAIDSMMLNTLKSTLYHTINILLIIDEYLLNFKFYPRIRIGPYSAFELGIFGILASFLGLYIFNIPSIPIPLKVSPILMAWLTDIHDQEYAELITRGIYDEWTIRSYGMSLIMIGFTGIWITKLFQDINRPECKFIGWTIFIAADNYN